MKNEWEELSMNVQQKKINILKSTAILREAQQNLLPN